MNKKVLSEADIWSKFVTPAATAAGWDEMTQVRREVSFTKGRIIVRGKLVTRGKSERADYILYRWRRDAAALKYAANLEILLVSSLNRDGFLFHDRTGRSKQLETELFLDACSKLWFMNI